MRQLKSHETPRNRGRNNKGKNASARLRQLKKRAKNISKKLQTKSTTNSKQDA